MDHRDLSRVRSVRPNGHARARQFDIFRRRDDEDEIEAAQAEAHSATAVADDDFPAVGTKEWGVMNRRRFDLIRKKNRQGLTAEEQLEFDQLQRLCFSSLEEAYPLPAVDEEVLRRLREGL